MSNNTSTTPLVVINIVGLTPSMLGADTPHLCALCNDGMMTPVKDVFPAVTCSAQSSMLTGRMPNQHGIVGNGWYFRDLAEIHFWKQSNHLVQGEKIWHRLQRHNPQFTVAQLFWWYNMYADVDYSITPRPHYPADGRKIVDLYSTPTGLHQSIEAQIGKFPFFNFWGPASDIRSSRWIVDSAIIEFDSHHPDLQLVYLPHLDYNLQRIGPDAAAISDDIRAIDHEAGRLIAHVREQGAEVMVVSEYGITAVDQSISINRVLRQAGLLKVRQSLDWELLDAGASEAFAVADHQIAHVYIKDPGNIKRIRRMLQATEGIEHVLDEHDQQQWHINHQRSGELIAVAAPGYWFDYCYWLNDNKAPDFATTVDIHNKPGYDPLELFLDPNIPFVKLKIARRLLQKKLGFRTLLDVIPLDTSLVRGSHGRLADSPDSGPVFISSKPPPESTVKQLTDVFSAIERHFTGQGGLSYSY